MVIRTKIPSERFLQAGDVVVDPAKRADMPKPIPVVNPVTDHALPSVAVYVLGTGVNNHRIKLLVSSLVIDGDVLETTPDVLVGKESNLGLPDLLHLRDRSEQWFSRHCHLVVTNAFPSWSQFVTQTLTTSAVLIMVLPPW
jgi:hypothetical protein